MLRFRLLRWVATLALTVAVVAAAQAGALVGPLPPDVQRITLVAAGVAAKSADPSAARAFIRFLASPDAADTIRRAGLEPVALR